MRALRLLARPTARRAVRHPGARALPMAMRRSYATAPAALPAEDMSVDAQQATGREKQELDGQNWDNGTVLEGPFGTPEKPVVVKSYFDSRIVGCVGGAHNEHELTWHVVSEGKPLVCLHCGQAFQLQKLEEESH